MRYTRMTQYIEINVQYNVVWRNSRTTVQTFKDKAQALEYINKGKRVQYMALIKECDRLPVYY